MPQILPMNWIIPISMMALMIIIMLVMMFFIVEPMFKNSINPMENTKFNLKW